jgi:hypothetical protein
MVMAAVAGSLCRQMYSLELRVDVRDVSPPQRTHIPVSLHRNMTLCSGKGSSTRDITVNG